MKIELKEYETGETQKTIQFNLSQLKELMFLMMRTDILNFLIERQSKCAKNKRSEIFDLRGLVTAENIDCLFTKGYREDYFSIQPAYSTFKFGGITLEGTIS